MREAARTHSDIDFIAVSHSEEEHTQKWLKSLPQYGSDPGNLRVVSRTCCTLSLLLASFRSCLSSLRPSTKTHQVTDSEREAYGAYGLGTSGWAHVLAPSALSSVFQLSKDGISNRPTESGSRWQTSGTYGIGADGMIKWGGPASRSDDMPDFEEAVRELGE